MRLRLILISRKFIDKKGGNITDESKIEIPDIGF